MQFRPVGKKIQCLVAVYDPETKRTRQRMVCSIERYGTFTKSAPSPDRLAFGSKEERAVWVQEIQEFIDAEKRKDEEDRSSLLPGIIKSNISDLIAAHQAGNVTNDELASVIDELAGLRSVLRKARRSAAKEA